MVMNIRQNINARNSPPSAIDYPPPSIPSVATLENMNEIITTVAIRNQKGNHPIATRKPSVRKRIIMGIRLEYPFDRYNVGSKTARMTTIESRTCAAPNVISI